MMRYGMVTLLLVLLVAGAACERKEGEAPSPITPGLGNSFSFPALTKAEAQDITEVAETFGLPVDDLVAEDAAVVNVKVFTDGRPHILVDRSVQGILDSIRFGYVTRIQLY